MALSKSKPKKIPKCFIKWDSSLMNQAGGLFLIASIKTHACVPLSLQIHSETSLHMTWRVYLRCWCVNGKFNPTSEKLLNCNKQLCQKGVSSCVSKYKIQCTGVVLLITSAKTVGICMHVLTIARWLTLKVTVQLSVSIYLSMCPLSLQRLLVIVILNQHT